MRRDGDAPICLAHSVRKGVLAFLFDDCARKRRSDLRMVGETMAMITLYFFLFCCGKISSSSDEREADCVGVRSSWDGERAGVHRVCQFQMKLKKLKIIC